MKPLKQIYGGRKPKSYRLAHNRVSENGFRRFWIPPQWVKSGKWVRCRCGFIPDPHFHLSDQVLKKLRAALQPRREE
jgi:hypothetical protein